MWWDDDTIERTVTRQFVCNQLIAQEIDRLDTPLSFGGNLTDGTYWDWIDEKAKKIFLILTDLGLPDQIFGVIDDSWDDEDLPIARDQVARLALTNPRDEKVERKFYRRQFCYLLRPLRQGEHIDYDDDEVVPLDVADKKHAVTQGHHVDKVTLPNEPGATFCRCRIPLDQDHLSWQTLMHGLGGIKDMQNQHLQSYWASYTHQGYAHVLFTPAPAYSLKSLLSTTPSGLKTMEKKARRQAVLDWIHCMVDTLSFLHNRGLAHGNIKPSTVLFSEDNHVFFSDRTSAHTDLFGGAAADSSSFNKETYDYDAPEKWLKPGPSTSPTFVVYPAAAEHGGNSAQAADVFSLGCVVLDLLSFLLKKHGRPFAAHRAAKHKTAGRGGAVPDSSFHKNLGQVESWAAQLAKDASKKEKDDPLFRGVAPMLAVVRRMLAFHPWERPTAVEVQASMYRIVTESCGISEPHCVHHAGGWDFGFQNLSLASSSDPGVEGGGGGDGAASSPEAEVASPLRRGASRGSGSSSKGAGRSKGFAGWMGESETEGRALSDRYPGSRPHNQYVIPRAFAQGKASQWQAPVYEGRYVVLMDR